MSMWLESVKESRGLDFLQKGMRVEMDGRPGVILDGNVSGNLNIRFDGEKGKANCHPEYRMKYFDKEGKLIKEFGD